MENITDLKPYLNLWDGEEILFINCCKNAYYHPIKNLSKFHEPDKFPKPLIRKKEEYYVYYPIDIITNYRIIFFGINFQYVKDDQVTPISEAIHIDNFIIWINNEDISDFEINFGDKTVNSFHFILYHKIFRTLRSPIDIYLSNSKDYFRMKELIINLFNFEIEDINQEEQQRIGSIIYNNKRIFFVSLMILLFSWWGIRENCNYYSSSEETLYKMLNYSSGSLLSLYLALFLILNLIHLIRLSKLQKARIYEDFFNLLEKNYGWYQDPLFLFLFSLN